MQEANQLLQPEKPPGKQKINLDTSESRIINVLTRAGSGRAGAEPYLSYEAGRALNTGSHTLQASVGITTG